MNAGIFKTAIKPFSVADNSAALGVFS